MNSSTNQPLNVAAQSKVLIFGLLLVPSIVFLVGVLPSLFLAFGMFLMKRNRNFSNMEAATVCFKAYAWIVLLGCAAFAIHAATKATPGHYSYQPWYRDDEVYGPATASAIAFAYIVLANVLFLAPLKAHRQWVEFNGIFSSNKRPVSARDDPEASIIKAEKLKTYSVADELLKWARLKDDGHVSEAEFNAAREKLLNRG